MLSLVAAVAAVIVQPWVPAVFGARAAALRAAAASAARLAAPHPAPSPSPLPGPIGNGWLTLHPPPDLGVHAASGVVVDLDTQELVWASSEHAQRAPASLTKLVTVMVALDLAGSPDRSVTVPAAATQVEADSTMMGLSPGESVTVRDLLYGVFLVSGNDAAETLAQAFVPRDRFVQLMNQKAAALGMRDSHFTNPTGLDDPGLHSSAYDLAIATVAIESRYAEVLPIAATRDIVLPPTPTHKEFDLWSLIKLLVVYPGATGLKTGYTDSAGYCLVGTATRGGRHLAVVLLGEDTQLTTDAGHLLDYAFGQPPAEAPDGGSMSAG